MTSSPISGNIRPMLACAGLLIATTVLPSPAEGQLRFTLGVEVASPVVLVNSESCHRFVVQDPIHTERGAHLDLYTGLDTVYAGACAGHPFLGQQISIQGTPDRVPPAYPLIGTTCKTSFFNSDTSSCEDGTSRRVEIFVDGVDLAVSDLTAPPGVLAGWPFDLTAKVSGEGYGESEPANLIIHQQIGERSYREAGAVQVSNFSAGTERTVSVSVTAPTDEGTYNYFARVDLHSDIPWLSSNNHTPDLPVTVFFNPCADQAASSSHGARGFVEECKKKLKNLKETLERLHECLTDPECKWIGVNRNEISQFCENGTYTPEECRKACKVPIFRGEWCKQYERNDGRDGRTRGQDAAVARSGFTDDPIVAGETVVKAVHFNELRKRIGEHRAALGLPQFLWTDAAITSDSPIRAHHIMEMRPALGEVYDELALPQPNWTEAVQTGATAIKAAHINEMRSAVVDLGIGGLVTTKLEAASSDPDVVEAAVLGGRLYLRPKRSGTAVITISATRGGIRLPVVLEMPLSI